MGQAGMKNNWKRNTRYMGVFAVLAAVFCMIVVLNINTGNVQKHLMKNHLNISALRKI